MTGTLYEFSRNSRKTLNLILAEELKRLLMIVEAYFKYKNLISLKNI